MLNSVAQSFTFTEVYIQRPEGDEQNERRRVREAQQQHVDAQHELLATLAEALLLPLLQVGFAFQLVPVESLEALCTFRITLGQLGLRATVVCLRCTLLMQLGLKHLKAS